MKFYSPCYSITRLIKKHFPLSQEVESPEDANLVLFMGGPDVHPALYGEPPIPGTSTNKQLDDADIEIFTRSKGKLKAGICRGGQLLNVLCGGKLWQDVNNHRNTHHFAFTRDKKRQILVTSDHHQMMIPSLLNKAEIILTANESSQRKSVSGKIQTNDDDIEAVWYPENRCLCYQPHPEWEPDSEDAKHFCSLIEKYL